ncbi:X-ray repair cross-complementing protein 6 [Cichlidogyrus casuarinus]|uniref:X-ray repair cross-complementing protein 6 n=1 Tax=Cichlidogyrus casuarinus TaxID=1844966 RepID=A0ABD2PVV2_9PLAT
MSLASDICDWVFVEAGVAQLESSQGRCETVGEGPPPRGQEWYMGQVAKSPQTLQRLTEASPISYVNDSWDLPIYMFLGANDLRVPMFQGEAFFKRVKACTAKTKVECEAIIYPKDTHPLDSVPAQIDSCSRILDIFDKKLI